MKKHLWDFVIEDIPCGWEETYQEALKECPNGCVIKSESDGDYGKSEYVYHPVKCRELLVSRFNEVKQQALTLFKSKNDLNVDVFVSGIIKTDAELFSLLTNWNYEDIDFDCSSFDPKDFLDGYDLEFYGNNNLSNNPYAKFRLVKFD